MWFFPTKKITKTFLATKIQKNTKKCFWFFLFQLKFILIISIKRHICTKIVLIPKKNPLVKDTFLFMIYRTLCCLVLFPGSQAGLVGNDWQGLFLLRGGSEGCFHLGQCHVRGRPGWEPAAFTLNELGVKCCTATGLAWVEVGQG